MKQVLQNIQSGAFAREWIIENQAGRPSFLAMRKQNENHMIEQVGKELRSMMPWLKPRSSDASAQPAQAQPAASSPSPSPAPSSAMGQSGDAGASGGAMWRPTPERSSTDAPPTRTAGAEPGTNGRTSGRADAGLTEN